VNGYVAISPLKRVPKPAERAAWMAETARLLDLKRLGSEEAPHLIIKEAPQNKVSVSPKSTI
jgi:hypothetical protein